MVSSVSVGSYSGYATSAPSTRGLSGQNAPLIGPGSDSSSKRANVPATPKKTFKQKMKSFLGSAVNTLGQVGNLGVQALQLVSLFR